MPMDASERGITTDLISAVGTLAAHLMTLHLQLGAVRTLLARRGTISDAEASCSRGSIGRLSRYIFLTRV
jgi:hypothetical protein